MNFSNLQFLGRGRQRVVYLLPSKKNVIKIPTNLDGEHANWLEAHRYKEFIKKREKHWKPARCRLIPGSSLLVMEYISELNIIEIARLKLRDSNPWIDFIDCSQVGFDSRGRLAAYDYAQ